MLKTGIILGAANVVTGLLRLFRNILVARLISVEDFGIASTFAITISLMEMTADLALDRLLIQKSNGDSTTLQATVQGLQAFRGAMSAMLLLLIAGPLANLFGILDHVWAFRTLALIPIMRGFAHFDMYRAQREMRFWPSIKVDIASIAGSTIAVVPLYFVFRDFRLMLCAILLQQVLFVLLSHLVAERKYRWQWDSATVRHAFAFGWPLLLNGVLMFLTFNGDRILVGNIFGMRDLGLFSAAFTITLAPTLVIAKTLNSFFLPLLSRSQSNKSEFRNLYLVTTQAALLAGALVAFVFAFAGPTLMIMVFGTDYVSAAPIVTWLGLMQAVRLAKAGPAIVATAKGETKNPMLANVARISIMPIAYLAVRNGFGLTAIVGLATLGEAFALLVSLYLLRSRLHMPLRMATSPLIVSSLVLGTVGIGDLLPSGAPIDMRIGQFFVALALILLLIRVMPDLRKWGVLAAPNLLK